jgi:hypothetical protein
VQSQSFWLQVKLNLQDAAVQPQKDQQVELVEHVGEQATFPGETRSTGAASSAGAGARISASVTWGAAGAGAGDDAGAALQAGKAARVKRSRRHRDLILILHLLGCWLLLRGHGPRICQGISRIHK